MWKTPVFTKEQIHNFLANSSDIDRWTLIRKVLCVFGICGGLGTDELRKVTVDKLVEVESGFDVVLTHSHG